MAKRTSTTTEKDDELISLDYAIKYLLRNKSDYAILEGFISTILKAIGYKPIKIDHILDPETDKEKKEEKRYITDLLVKDEEGRRKKLFDRNRQVLTSIPHRKISPQYREGDDSKN
jgi:molybdopterin-guanine dinucleotide biosynthesis protein